jgi:CheY-like chemotaxis protein
MPGLSGVELQSRFIADGHPMPIIGITASPEDPDADAGGWGSWLPQQAL